MSSTFDPDAVEAVAFDSYGTLVDVSGVADALEPHLEEADPALVATIWRQRSLAYAMVGNAIGEYDTFYAMNRHALRFALETVDVDLEEAEREAVLETYHELPVFDDVRDGIERVRDLGYDCYVVSNGNEAMLESLVDHADLGDLLVDTISADEVERFKPQPRLYRHAADRIDAPTESIAFVGAGWWDVPGAMNAGLQGVWINRQDTLWGPYDVEPDLTIETIHDLAAELEGA
ncbi:haloacid dehalogenase type II [Natronosalvus caseinilyticus]|uniref:haloacid dehalogenase type II n=1 Tax=Natronosalvus caseinilyticus TaxID=2953747 RepID=UPI0028AD1D9B|nr:haloacid dehalogenase type II [Natronosalvus caseinilyticus]